MDEIDAALDFKNVSIVGNYIKERTKNAQFIVISLRSNMFELADYLVGIYKTYNCSKSVTLNLGRYYENNGILPPTQLTSKSYATQASQRTQALLSQRVQVGSRKENTAPVLNNNNAKETQSSEERVLSAKDNNTKEVVQNGEKTPQKTNNKETLLNAEKSPVMKSNNAKKTQQKEQPEVDQLR